MDFGGEQYQSAALAVTPGSTGVRVRLTRDNWPQGVFSLLVMMSWDGGATWRPMTNWAFDGGTRLMGNGEPATVEQIERGWPNIADGEGNPQPEPPTHVKILIGPPAPFSSDLTIELMQ